MSTNEFFNGPSFTKVIDEDPQFIRVPLKHSEWGSRMSTMNNINQPDDAVNLKHVPNE